jgi:hypothetical protein
VTGEFGRGTAVTRGKGQRVPAPGVGDFADDHDLFRLTDATDLKLPVSGLKAGGKSVPAKGRPARAQEHDVVCHQSEQALKIAGVNRVDPGCMQLTDGSFVRSHLQPPLAGS